ncbi:MAG: hypothetical protein B6D34_09825 [Candidatus Brocadia sp. UTAMX1]|jgi:hypothetical protein|nr:MAG: hypothetical protein B6D34_09825 [Candidatus Brocadia sp. UTAMX1]
MEDHIFVSFLAFCLNTTLRNLAQGKAGGLTSETVLEKLSGIQMIDVHLPTTDGRHTVMAVIPSVKRMLFSFWHKGDWSFLNNCCPRFTHRTGRPVVPTVCMTPWFF